MWIQPYDVTTSKVYHKSQMHLSHNQLLFCSQTKTSNMRSNILKIFFINRKESTGFVYFDVYSAHRCIPWQAALHSGPVLSKPVPKQGDMQNPRGQLLVLLCAGVPGCSLSDWCEWVCFTALQEWSHLCGQSGQVLLSVFSWVHWWVDRTVLGLPRVTDHIISILK